MVKASIIVLCFNGLEDVTRPCLDSIYRNTRVDDFELIVVDNASSDGTADYLRQFEKMHPNIKIQLNEMNKGYAGGNNDGMQLAQGEYLVLLNNDTLVPPNWLDRLLFPLETDNSIGMVGPVTNSAGNEQRIELPGLNEDNYENVAAKYIERQKDIWFTTAKLGFFCVAMRRALFERVGHLDEDFGIGMFEDDDYCARVLACGYKLVVTEGCFVYHKGSMSFKKLSSETYRAIFDKNRAIYFSKHHALWTYSDIAKALWKKIIDDLQTCSGDSTHDARALERVRVRVNDLNNIIYTLHQLEEGYAKIQGKPFNEIALADKNRKLMEISDWATSLKQQLDGVNKELDQIKNSNYFRVYRIFTRLVRSK